MNRLATTSTPDLQPLPLQWAAKLMDRLQLQLGVKMADLYAGADRDKVQAEWAVALTGYQPHEIARGLARCSDSQFAPTIGEFKRCCRPALDPETAWGEAQKGLAARERGELGQWSHPAVWRAARAMGFEIRSGSFRQHRSRWVSELTQEFEAGWGDPVPPVQKRVENNPTLKPMPEAIRAKLAAIGLYIKTGTKS